jgi:regulatory protein
MYSNYKKKRKPIYDETTGVPPTEEQIEKMTRQAKNVAFYWVDQADKSRHELFTKIKNKGITDEIANEVLDSLEEKDYINDQRFAENFVYSKQTYDKLGKRAIGFKLKSKGVAQHIIDNVLMEIVEDDEEEAARDIIERKLMSTANLDPQKRLTRLASLLVRKGYSTSMAFRVVKEMIALEAEENYDE